MRKNSESRRSAKATPSTRGRMPTLRRLRNTDEWSQFRPKSGLVGLECMHDPMSQAKPIARNLRRKSLLVTTLLFVFAAGWISGHYHVAERIIGSVLPSFDFDPNFEN